MTTNLLLECTVYAIFVINTLNGHIGVSMKKTILKWFMLIQCPLNIVVGV